MSTTPYQFNTMPFRAVENSKNTSGESGNNPAGGSGQLTIAQIDQLNQLARDGGKTHYQNHVFMDTDAQMQSHYTNYAANYNLRTLEGEAKAWALSAHTHGMNVVWRGSWSGVKGNNNFPFVTYGGGNFVPLGTVAGASTEGETTYCGKMWRFMDVNVGADNIESGDIFAPISEFTEYLSNSNYIWFDTSAGTQTGLYNFFVTMHQVVDAYGASIGKRLGFMSISNYSEYKSGYIDNTLPADTDHLAIDYYGHSNNHSNGQNVSPANYVTDWLAVWNQGSLAAQYPIYQTEMGGIFGDSWPQMFSSFPPVTITAVDTSTNRLTATGNSLLRNNRIRFTTTGTLPAPLVTTQEYFVEDIPASNQFTVSLTAGGSAIDITTSGSGTSTVQMVNTYATIKSYEESAFYQIKFWQAYRDSLMAAGAMNGVSNWGDWSGQNSSIVKWDSVNGYSENYFGQIYSCFTKGNGLARIPVPQTGSFGDDSWGGRSISF